MDHPLRALLASALAALLAACGDHATNSVDVSTRSAISSVVSPSAGGWYVSPDGRLGVLRGQEAPWLTGEQDIKVPWLRPVGTTLRISGQRLNGPASPLHASVPEGYAGEFQVSGLTFPTPGCWQIQGQAGDSVVRFVVAIAPRA